MQAEVAGRAATINGYRRPASCSAFRIVADDDSGRRRRQFSTTIGARTGPALAAAC